MAQATLDLPDPTEQQAPANGSADDLLAQLAGDEIDRLLAEAAAPQAQAIETVEQELAVAEQAAAPAAEDTAAPAAEAGVDLQAQLDDLFGKLTSDDAPAPEPAPTAAEAQAPTAEPESPAEVESSPQERAALAAADAPELQADEPADDAEPEQLPIYLRPLAWLNAPLAGTSDGVRDAIGKVAILTLINAIGILLYVILFRKAGL